MPSKKLSVRLKRAYEQPAPEDGTRVLVDRLWPRGLSKEKAAINVWLRDVAPSTPLRQWFGHEVAKWPEFRQRYTRELQSGDAAAALEQLKDLARHGPLTLVFAARDTEHCNAVVLRELLTGAAG